MWNNIITAHLNPTINTEIFIWLGFNFIFFYTNNMNIEQKHTRIRQTGIK
jgi:hypothetical protein